MLTMNHSSSSQAHFKKRLETHPEKHCWYLSLSWHVKNKLLHHQSLIRLRVLCPSVSREVVSMVVCRHGKQSTDLKVQSSMGLSRSLRRFFHCIHYHVVFCFYMHLPCLCDFRTMSHCSIKVMNSMLPLVRMYGLVWVQALHLTLLECGAE